MRKPRGGSGGIRSAVSAPRGRRLAGLTAALLVLAALGLVSCSHEDSGQVVFWQFQRPDLIEGIVGDFEAANPSIDVRVETLTWQSGYEKIVMAFASGKVPDLLEVGSTWLPTFQAEGAIEPLGRAASGLEDSLIMWDMCTFGGDIYGIPWLIGTRVLFYNRALFRGCGLSPDRAPATWSAMLDAAKAIHDPDRGIYGFGMNAGERYVLYKKFMPFAWGNGGRILSDDLGASELDSEANLEALRFYLSLEPYSVLERQDMIDQMFKQGKIGMMISGGWNLERIPEDAPGLDFGIALVPKPDRDGFHASFAGAEILVFPKGGRAEPAMKLARYLVGARQALRISSVVKGVQPASKQAVLDPYYEEHPMERLLLEQCRSSLWPPPSPDWVEIEEVINSRLEECLYGNRSPEEALALMDREVSAIVGR